MKKSAKIYMNFEEDVVLLGTITGKDFYGFRKK